MVRFDEKTKQYYLYATLGSPTIGNLGIVVSTSTDLDDWKTVRTIPLGADNKCDESPFVVEHDGWYYLWTTVSSVLYYRGIPTRIFRSQYADFRDLADTREEHSLYSIPLHAIEIVETGDTTWIGQTGHEGPGIVFSRLRWGIDGTMRPVDLNQVVWTGEWAGADRRASSRPGDAFECRFTGGRVEWRGNKSPSGGQATIFLDGKRMGTIDQYGFDKSAPGNEYPGTFLWTSEDLAQGEHILRAVVSEQRNPVSQGSLITVAQVVVTEFNAKP
jgi:hypothetical protein